jgi:heptosyltransferase-3
MLIARDGTRTMLRRNVLIFHAGALGDFVLTWPLAIALGRLYPQSRIVYVTAASKGKLAEKVLGVDARDAETGWPALFAADASPDEAVSKALVGAHAIYDFVAGPASAWAANVARLAEGAEVTHLPGRPPAEYGKHVTDFLLDGLSARPAARTAVEQILRSVRERGVATRHTVGDAVVVHPGSGSTDKSWPLVNFVELARRLREKGRPVRFLLGEVERERWPASDVERLREFGDVVTPSDYVALHAALIGAAAFVGNDSGPTHLAGICGVPTIAIFRASDPNVWSPVGPRVTVVGSGDKAPGVEEVVGAL